MTTTAKVVVNDVDDTHGGTVCVREITVASLGGGGGPVSWDDVANKPTTFTPTTHSHDASYAAVGHSHDASYAAVGHNHDATYAQLTHSHSYEAAGAVSLHEAAANPHPVYLTQAEADQLYQAAGAGGSDPWTYLRTTSDFTASAAAAVNITGLGFTPAANTRYEFVARLYVRTATATVGPRPGVAWATGLTDGVVFIQQTSSATANVFSNGNINAAVLAPVGGLPNTTQSWPALIEGWFVAGANPSGDVRLQLASETAGTNVFCKAGSFLKYRTVP